MKKGRSGSNEAVHVGGRVAAARAISPENIDAFFAQVGEKLREGRSGEAERLLLKTIESYDHSPDNFANLKRLLAFTLETTGRYKESLDAIQPFETEENRARLSTETQVRVIAQLAIAYNNVGDQPKAVTLLKDTLARAEENELRHLYGTIHIALARVYRRLSEYPISRDHANKALASFRETGNWLGMAEAYREIANSLHQEGNSEKAIENFQLGIKIIDGNSAPFMLGKLYTETDIYRFFRDDHAINVATRTVEAKLSGAMPLDIFVFEGTVVNAPNGTGEWNRFAGRPMKDWVADLAKVAGDERLCRSDRACRFKNDHRPAPHERGGRANGARDHGHAPDLHAADRGRLRAGGSARAHHVLCPGVLAVHDDGAFLERAGGDRGVRAAVPALGAGDARGVRLPLRLEHFPDPRPALWHRGMADQPGPGGAGRRVGFDRAPGQQHVEECL